ncbi:MAG: hypothetical protein E6Q97_39015 [Desulfurellales bacterium]|nr:MAG: hypothetical protein E6Q97_39015 [Desulfurellales bacterium]
MQIESDWTPEARLFVIEKMAAHLSELKYAHETVAYAAIIQLVASAPSERLEKDRSLILRMAKLESND